MIIPAVGQENIVVKTDATGKIQGENKEGENLLSFIREVRQILENPAIQRMITQKLPPQKQTDQDQPKQDQQQTENEGFDATMLMKLLSSKKGCIQFAQGLDMIILSFGDKKLSAFRDMILEQADVSLSEYQAVQNDVSQKPEFKEVKDDEKA